MIMRAMTLMLASLLLASAGLFGWIGKQDAEVGSIASEFARSLVRLERAIGYAGFIHHFKNLLLRPDEPRYGELALRSYERAAEQLIALQALLDRADIPADLSRLRGTLDNYHEQVAIVQDAHGRGLSIAEIDRLVRTPDALAVSDLDDMQAQVESLLRERARTNSWIRWASLVVATALLLAFIAGLVITIRQDRRQRQLSIERDKQAAVATLKEQLQTVTDTVSSGIVALDGRGQVVMANPRARHMLGGVSQYPPFAWPQDIRFLDTENMQPLEASRDPVHRALVGQRLQAETKLMTRHGSDVNRYVRINSAVADNPDSDIRAVLALDDVTTEEKNRQRVERSARLDALGQLTGGIAHDFNNLLGMILGSVELAKMRPDDPESSEQLDVAIKAVNRGADLTKRLLAFARRQPGLAKAQLVEESFAQVIALTKTTIEKNIRIEVRTEQPDLWAFCDPGQLENAILNLIINARDAIVRSGRGNRILLRVRAIDLGDVKDQGSGGHCEGGAAAPDAYRAKPMPPAPRTGQDHPAGHVTRYVDIAVTDNGPGMSDEVKRRAIDPFFTTKDANSGTGLGLSMVYGFVQQSNGELSIYSELGTGTTIRILLPRAEPHGEPEASVSPAPIEQGRGRIVLAVEDEAELLGLLTASLEAIGYRVRVAANGIEALEILQTNEPIDLLLTDIVMPGDIGGFELARKARQIRPALAVVYMSGYTGFEKAQMGEVIAPMLEKPCSMLELSRVLKAEFEKFSDRA